jgi:hypothetical protein
MSKLEKFAPAVTAPAAPLQDIFAEICEAKAYLWLRNQIELPDAVDQLQEYAKRTGLIAAIGQDAVQALMGKPFALVQGPADPALQQLTDELRRNVFAALRERFVPDRIRHELDEYDRLEIARRIERWEAADAERPKPYRTPPATIDEFWHIVRLDDPPRLLRWLHQHPKDAAYLEQLLEEKCQPKS